jgi:hypothetical protein
MTVSYVELKKKRWKMGKLLLERENLLIRYVNGLEYMRNNPNLTAEEVNEHYGILKEIRAIEKMLEDK